MIIRLFDAVDAQNFEGMDLDFAVICLIIRILDSVVSFCASNLLLLFLFFFKKTLDCN